MSLITTLNLTANGRVSVKLKNHSTGQENKISWIALGSFGSGTVAAQISPDGTNWVDNIDNGASVTFNAADARAIVANSDEQQPVYLGFNLTGATSPDIDIYIYDNKA